MSSSPQLGPLPERMKRLLCTGVDADVHFLVGEEGGEQELLSAHKLILKSASEVFDAMFRFDEEPRALAKKRKITIQSEASSEESNSGQVRIPDVDIEAFKTMLDFIYTDNLSGVNGKNAFEVLYTAKKYNLPMLVKACVDIPISELDDVFIALVQARFLEEKDFAGRCLAYIDRNADTLIKSDEFLQIDQKLLCELLGRDQLVVTGELAIWNCAIRWADEQCRQKDGLFCGKSATNAENIQKDFLKNIVKSCVLTSAELVGVLLFHSLGDSSNGDAMSEPYPLLFPIRQRSAKSAGKLTLKIEKFSEFSQANDMSRIFSEAVYIGGFLWKIYAQINTISDIKYMSLFILCNAGDYGSDWSCPCSASLRIFSQKQGKPDYASTFDQTFNTKPTSWGYLQFKSLVDMMDPNNGWYLEEEDTVILSAEMTVKE